MNTLSSNIETQLFKTLKQKSDIRAIEQLTNGLRDIDTRLSDLRIDDSENITFEECVEIMSLIIERFSNK